MRISPLLTLPSLESTGTHLPMCRMTLHMRRYELPCSLVCTDTVPSHGNTCLRLINNVLPSCQTSLKLNAILCSGRGSSTQERPCSCRTPFSMQKL